MAKRTWTLDLRDFQTEEEFRAAVQTELAQFEHIGHRIGLALTAAPIRERFDRDFVTVGWAFRTDTVPTARETPREAEAPVAPEEPAPVIDAVETAF